MARLSMILFAIVSTTLMGSGIVFALTIGADTLRPILLAAGAGLAAAVPVTWAVARRLARP